MLERELMGSVFLRPVQSVACDSGYLDKDQFANALKTAYEIGHYDERGRFIKNRELMIRYASVIREIADALRADTHDALYRKYKLASLDKGTLRVMLEWRPASELKVRELSLHSSRFLKQSAGRPTFLVDMQGPAYEVIAPDTVDAFISDFVIETANFSNEKTG